MKSTCDMLAYMGVAERLAKITCVRCGRDWTDELRTRVDGKAGSLWQVMCSCGGELYAEGTKTGIRLVAGLERRPA